MQGFHMIQLTEERLTLNINTVYLWLINIDNEIENMDHLRQLLSIEEMDRANRFVFEKDKQRYIVTHSILRLIISKIISLEPLSIRFTVKKRDKPCLNHPEHQDIHFNLSHSGKYIIIALALKTELGIDIEFINPVLDRDQMVLSFCSKQEIDTYHQLPVDLKIKAFYTCWSRKEAFIKAIGEGLYFPLNDFSASIDSRTKPELTFHGKVPFHQNWTILDIPLDDKDYVSALVFEGSGYQVQFNYWTTWGHREKW